MILDIYTDVLGYLFWILLFIAMLSPWLSIRSLQRTRLRLIELMERKYGSRVITMIHRQEKIGLLGVPIYRYIDIEDSEAIIRAIRTTPPNIPIMLILHTPGGLVLAASQIAKALKAHPAKKIVVVPHYAMSGGTLIALAADEIIMDPNAVLGPVDPQLGGPSGMYLPAPSIIRAVEIKGKDKVDDQTLILADMAEKAINQVRDLVIELIKDKVGEERAKYIADKLVSGYYTHDYPITVEQLRDMGGLKVSTDVPPEVYELMMLYPQARTNRPGIEYLPYPMVPRPTTRETRSDVFLS
ncbi:ATP-dependent Clp protease proteolytic subunit [Vulcanisaeta souniana]|uniref:SDH family Clp fold serine proteinase n=1 Tax=Vulcanisaeta souniana TaxID=164452 RepID=UPI0006D1EC43|nr:ATP-dependent Clp protease proteolytic subunit [Vulcanisaeta souniana]